MHPLERQAAATSGPWNPTVLAESWAAPPRGATTWTRHLAFLCLSVCTSVKWTTNPSSLQGLLCGCKAFSPSKRSISICYDHAITSLLLRLRGHYYFVKLLSKITVTLSLRSGAWPPARSHSQLPVHRGPLVLRRMALPPPPSSCSDSLVPPGLRTEMPFLILVD